MATATAMDELSEYAPILATKRNLPQAQVLMAVESLPVEQVPFTVYRRKIAEARRRVGKRDPDDVDTLALAIHTGYTLWSNDKDFEQCAVEWLTTAQLLAKLGI